MLFETSLVKYESIKLNNTEITLDGNYRVSFNPPYNKVDITFTLLETSLSYYEARVTADADSHGIGIGNLAFTPETNLALNRTHTVSINVTPEVFNKGPGVYRVSLYAKSALDGTWDVTYLLLTIDDFCLQLSDGAILGVGTAEAIPS